MHIRHDIAAVYLHRFPGRHAQSDVQRRPPFAGIDGVALEHGVDPRRQPAFLGQLRQKLQGSRGNPVLGIVQVPAGRLQRQARPSRGVFYEELPQVDRAQFFQMACQCLPGVRVKRRGVRPRFLHVHRLPPPTRASACTRTSHVASRCRQARVGYGIGRAPRPCGSVQSRRARLVTL
ncbi:hypothetical protein D3C72_1599910 [compost metagenome]